MSGRRLTGRPASPGSALGEAWRRPDVAKPGALVAWEDQERERDTALDALAQAAQELEELALTLPPDEAEIVDAGVLMAHDPALRAAIEEAVLARGLAAADALLDATEQHAVLIASLGDEMLAARADDVRSLGRRAARLMSGAAADAPPGSDVVLIADDLGPADVAELAPSLSGIALSAGGPTAHAAIVARSLGIPMVTGLGASLHSVPDGTLLALDASAGIVTVDPAGADAASAGELMGARREAGKRDRAERDLPAVTTDGKAITVLANAATAAELELGQNGGAEGIGLLRTELAFLDAHRWPDEQQHTDLLEPILERLGGAPAVIRVLDFGADKAPPFLAGIRERGIELLLEHDEAFVQQLRAIVACSPERDVRVLIPMVESAAQVAAVREALERVAVQLGATRVPPLGSMIETPLAAERAEQLAAASDFLSIGTNDLTATVLGLDRFAVNDACTHDPRVLSRIARSVIAAHRAGLVIEVCGEAASDPVMLPLLIGLGVDELSVGAARVGEVRRWVRGLSAGAASALASRALELDSAAEVEELVKATAPSAEGRNGGGERAQGFSGIRAVGA
jgi:phosphoenolpyruvate-protein kinase (PTS system EI component)